ncbi:sugar kinase [Ancylothrix sp. C2]|uniref:sugar kinase n=1 Tax=Ancylothrix sp. D3o TaxID=2953691 RepID=UPI0021BA4ABC|nr:sugar kinase [Ancylothrix sp. D3o]MCT7952269.1 sugar kinase [Ancylothrix sp. D3o]
MKRGIFAGLVTLDFVYLTADFLSANQKVVALDSTVAAGGPATNAAVTFSFLGNESILLGGVGKHPITQLILADLKSCGVELIDLDSQRLESPPVSSIIVTQSTGERAVISINATKSQVNGLSIEAEILNNIDIVLVDGHQLEVGEKIAGFAKNKNLPVVLDGGSWKPGLEKLLPLVNYAVCSENFYPPGCKNVKDVFAYLAGVGILNIAVTRGEKSILYHTAKGKGEVCVPSINAVVDTLGAGDIFHGAFCYYILQEGFIEALESAAKIAAYSCQFFGTRRWMDE